MKKIVFLVLFCFSAVMAYAGVECNGSICTFVPDVKNEHIVVLYADNTSKCEAEGFSKTFSCDMKTVSTFKPDAKTAVKYVFVSNATKIDTTAFPSTLTVVYIEKAKVTVNKKEYSLEKKEDVAALKKVLGVTE